MKTKSSFNGKEINLIMKISSPNELFDNWGFVKEVFDGVIKRYELSNMDYNAIAKIIADKYITVARNKRKNLGDNDREMRDYDVHCTDVNFFKTPFGVVIDEHCTSDSWEDTQWWHEYCLLSDFTQVFELKLYELEQIDYREEERIPIYKLYPFYKKSEED